MAAPAIASNTPAEQAAEWLAGLGVTDPAERERIRAGFEAWKAADPRHAQAAAPMERWLAALQPLQGAGARAARAALQAGEESTTAHRRRSRARAAAGLAAAVVAALAVWAGVRDEWPQALVADLRTGAGEWRSQPLPDGSRLTLAAGSAVDLHFDGDQRTVRLLRGDILVDVARDPARPFVVRTRDGEVRALGTQFVVERGAESTRLAMIESATAVRSARQVARHADDAVRVQAGEQVRITPEGVTPLAPVDPQGLRTQWQQRQWVVLDRPLAEVLDELARRHPGHLGYDAAQIAGLRVSAVLPLDDPDRALALLQGSFPQLRVTRLTRFWVRVDRTG